MNVVPVVFDLRETKLGFLGVDSDVLSAKELEYALDEYAGYGVEEGGGCAVPPIGSTCADTDRTDLENMSMYSLQRLLSCECNHSNDFFIWHFGVRTLGTHFECIYRPQWHPAVGFSR